MKTKYKQFSADLDWTAHAGLRVHSIDMLIKIRNAAALCGLKWREHIHVTHDADGRAGCWYSVRVSRPKRRHTLDAAELVIAAL